MIRDLTLEEFGSVAGGDASCTYDPDQQTLTCDPGSSGGGFSTGSMTIAGYTAGGAQIGGALCGAGCAVVGAVVGNAIGQLTNIANGTTGAVFAVAPEQVFPTPSGQ